MAPKKLLLFAAGISAAWLLYQKISRQQQKNDSSVEIKSDLQALNTALHRAKDTTAQLKKQLAESSFADELQDSLAEYQFKIQPIVKRIEELQKQWPALK